MYKRKRLLDLLRRSNVYLSSGVSYLLRDEFTTAKSAGAVNGTAAEPGPGTRTVTDTGNRISIGSDLVSFTAGPGAWGDPQLAYGPLARTAGRMLLIKLTHPIGTGAWAVGFDDNGTGQPTNGAIQLNSDTLSFQGGGTMPSSLVTLVDGTDYYLAVVLRAIGGFAFIKGGAFTVWRLLWLGGTNAASTVYPLMASYSNITSCDFIRVPQNLWLPTPLASDSFNRANGILGSTDGAAHAEANGGSGLAWTGSTWTISTNKAINTPTDQTEILLDPGLEATYTAGLCNGFASQLAPTVAEDTTNQRTGSKCQRFTAGTANMSIYQNQTHITLSTGTWYKISQYVKRTSGTTNDVVPLWTSAGFLSNTSINSVASYSAYTELRMYNRCIDSTNIKISWLNGGANTASPDTVVMDDVSVKALTLSELISSVVTSTPNVNITCDISLNVNAPTFGYSPCGIISCLDDASNPQNFLLVTVFQTGGSNNRIVFEKCVGGVYTTLISTTATYAAGARLTVIKDGNSVSVYYNNAQVGTTQTVSDAGIINNTKHGLFSTYSGNTLDNFQVWAVGSEGQYSILDKYIR